jgi:hypothetical protein
VPRAPPETSLINVARADNRDAAAAQQLRVARAEQHGRGLVLQRVAQFLRILFVHAGHRPQAPREQPFQFERKAPGTVEQAGDAFGIVRGDGQFVRKVSRDPALECGRPLQG